MKAVLITIGDEILSGNTVDTNSNFIATELKKIGIPVVQILTISDEINSIKNGLETALDLGDLVIATGGLGPTKDDKTKTAFKEFFNDEIILDPETFDHLRKLFDKRNRGHLLELNKPQAEVLSKAFIFQNENGSAPCQMIRENGKIIISLPGVPFEVKPLIKDKIIPFLAEQFSLNHIVTQTVSVVGIPESLLSDQIESWELALPTAISLSYLPVGNRIKLRLTAQGKSKEDLEKNIENEVEKLKPLIGNNVISWNGDKIEEILKEILDEKKLTVSTAESCTGGELSRLLTSISGSSTYFSGGIVAYDYQKKIEILGVSEKTIQQKTAVSEKVAQEMSLGSQQLFKTNISLSTTGVAGPNPDEFNNEIGVAYFSIRVNDFEKTSRLHLPHFERNDFVNFVSQRVLQDLVEILIKEKY
ncbi:CinA family nicotinamide mononucleotide deamidase-related protein [Kaistella antarctica]|uniref:CinA-like protein n=1 Tax=Kaistella antarctica TaxID=266748 RepID=A0A448NR75_9FLAO|nr:CinA family nicotinamide mononucleotide deamidase-related protein [Kaistella antarctica]KEY18892.1 damage-inducible protein CinA [Kaistella antarctica]SEW14185.1 nicotinamide-nucleotide amidase [Kaistella antarctica]VEH99275.1 CinA-like protein [Kaistella antarctica]